MLGYKAKAFKAHPRVSLDDLVPEDNFYRQLDPVHPVPNVLLTQYSDPVRSLLGVQDRVGREPPGLGIGLMK